MADCGLEIFWLHPSDIYQVTRWTRIRFEDVYYQKILWPGDILVASVSMEEAKKNKYAFSTTTYTGFQCTVSEELAEKFKGLPGVLWVLPDSFLFVKNKDYGGDKFINGEIIPRTYPTYQPNQSNGSKSESTRYERQKDNPPAQRRTHQDNALPESTS